MDFLTEGLVALVGNYKVILMFLIGGVLIFLAIKKNVEPALLLPIGFGAILVNIPLSGVVGSENDVVGIIEWLYKVGIEASEALPLLLFIGIGAMIDFGPLLSNPKLFFFGAAAQVGIFLTIIVASFFYSINDAAAIGIIGAADGPTSILVSNMLNVTEKVKSSIVVVAYSYMALVPLIQPATIKLVTTKKERMLSMPYYPNSVSKTTKILFPIIVTLVAGLIAPKSVSLVGFLMFGNLIRECGVLNNLTETATKTLSNLVTLVLGITIAFNMKADAFISVDTLIVMGLGLLAFVFDTVGGVMFAKFLNLFLKNKINPMVGAAGISAFPMSARVVQKLGQEANSQNHLLMHAVGANVSGQIASVIAGGFILSIL